jgi:hypothetical protein
MGRHLSAAEFLDLVEGATDEGRYPHLASCDSCRAELADARAALSLARAVDVPEPSPLFWDHLSARVHDAVAAERWSGGGRPMPWMPWRLAVPVGAAALTIAIVLGVLPRISRTVPATQGSPVAVDAGTAGADTAIADDPSLSFVADLASELDWDGVVQAGFAARPGAVDGVLPTLSASETAELQRLLTEALADQPARGGV